MQGKQKNYWKIKVSFVLKMDSLAPGKGVLVPKKTSEAKKFLNNVEKETLGR